MCINMYLFLDGSTFLSIIFSLSKQNVKSNLANGTKSKHSRVAELLLDEHTIIIRCLLNGFPIFLGPPHGAAKT